MRLPSLLSLLLLTGLLAAQANRVASPAPKAGVEHLSFGVYTSERATAMYETFTPLLEELALAASQQLKHDVQIHLRIFKTYEMALDALTHGDVDFVRFGPASYVLAKRDEPGIQLLAVEQEDGLKRCKGVIVVRLDSPIQSLSELKGKKFAFGDDNSTIGRYLAQAELAKAGLHASDLASFRYLDRHDKVAKAVEVGDYDAGPVHIATFEAINKEQKKLRVIASFDNVGKPWIARAGLDARITNTLTSALLGMKSPKHLEVLKVHGFLPAHDEDYDLVRQGMKKAAEFEVPAAMPAHESASRPSKK